MGRRVPARRPGDTGQAFGPPPRQAYYIDGMRHFQAVSRAQALGGGAPGAGQRLPGPLGKPPCNHMYEGLPGTTGPAGWGIGQKAFRAPKAAGKGLGPRRSGGQASQGQKGHGARAMTEAKGRKASVKAIQGKGPGQGHIARVSARPFGRGFRQGLAAGAFGQKKPKGPRSGQLRPPPAPPSAKGLQGGPNGQGPSFVLILGPVTAINLSAQSPWPLEKGPKNRSHGWPLATPRAPLNHPPPRLAQGRFREGIPKAWAFAFWVGHPAER
jgi:hypothetical protein